MGRRPPRTAASAASATSEVAASAEALYALPLAEFVSARAARVKELKDRGAKDDAAAVMALPKPSLVAWTLNQLYRTARGDFDALLKAGDDLREAQHGALRGEGGDAMRAGMRARRIAIGKLRVEARAILDESGHASSAGTLSRVEGSLLALANAAQRPHLGELHEEPGHASAEDDDPFGLGALAPLLAERVQAKHVDHAKAKRAEPEKADPPPPEHHARRSTDDAEAEKERRLAEKRAREAVDAATREHEAARVALRRAETSVEKADREATRAKQRAHAAEQAATTARAEATEAEEEARRAHHARDEADRSEKATARALSDARSGHGVARPG